MGLLLAILLLTWALKKAVGDSIVDNNYAKQGLVSPRMEAKYGADAAARVARYGFLDFLRDAWRDAWMRRTDALIAARDAKAANPGERVRFADRWAAARQVMSKGWHRVVDPVEPKPAAVPAQREPEPAVEPAPEVGTVRYTDAGRELWDGTAWVPAPEPTSAPAAEPVAPAADDTDPTYEPKHYQEPNTEAPAMTAPTGEAVNYETTVAELEAQIREQRAHVDHCTTTLAHIASAKESVNNMQESYRTASAAAASTHEHLAANNLDSTTLGHTGTTADAMPAGVVDQMYDNLEAVEAVAQQRLADAEAALASTEAALDHVQRTYSDAHETVAGNLGGDSRFLDSGVSAPAAGGREAALVGAGGNVDTLHNRMNGAADNATS